jgi:hypothetical protein
MREEDPREWSKCSKKRWKTECENEKKKSNIPLSFRRPPINGGSTPARLLTGTTSYSFLVQAIASASSSCAAVPSGAASSTANGSCLGPGAGINKNSEEK